MLATATSSEQRRQPSHWPPAVGRDSPYSRLLEFISSRAEEATVVDRSRTCLDDRGAPDGAINWPIDYVLRVPRLAPDLKQSLTRRLSPDR